MKDFWKELTKPIIGLAPMDGVTDEPARQIQCSVVKPDVIYTEFVSAEGFVRNPKAFEKTLFFGGNERPIIAQVFGYTPEAFFEAVSSLVQMGFDGIDINMGCPAKSVLQKGGGGDLIGNYPLSEKIILSSIEAVKKSKKEIPLSVKTRLGKNEIITDQWIPFLSKFPLSEITVHGRLLKQGNSGIVNWEEIQKAGEICHKKGIVCLGNGGIKSMFEAKEKAKLYGLDGVLIGQAACGNPWIFGDIVPTKEMILEIILEHARLTEKFYDHNRFVTVLKYFSWYPKGFSNCVKLKTELLKTRNYAQVKEVIGNFRKIN